MAFLKRDGAVGRRIGVLRQASRPGASDPQVLALFDRAVADLHRAGAEIIDPFVIPEFDQFPPSLHPLSEVRAAIERYLARTGPTFPKSLLDIMASGKFHPLPEVGLLATASAPARTKIPLWSNWRRTRPVCALLILRRWTKCASMWWRSRPQPTRQNCAATATRRTPTPSPSSLHRSLDLPPSS